MLGNRKHISAFLLFGLLVLQPVVTHAQTVPNIPGSADVGRINPAEKEVTLPKNNIDITLPKGAENVSAPEQSKSVSFILKQVDIEGATVFSQEQLKPIYQEYLNKQVTLDIVWVMANKITEKYRDKGYFLSRAYVPEQHIKDGKVVIKIVEGYIGKVDIDDHLYQYSVVKDMVNGITAEKPITSARIESFLLRLNDLPGESFRAVLSEMDDVNAGSGAVKLTLKDAHQKGNVVVNYDNYGSRYLGPNEGYVTYRGSIIPLQQTTISFLSSLPADELRYGTVDHVIPLTSNLSWDFGGGITKASPGYSLEAYDINSRSLSLSTGLSYQLIRQRERNLTIKLDLDGKDTSNEISSVPLNRDHVRATRLSAIYEQMDKWAGYNVVDFTISQGIAGMGASNKGDVRLSRLEAIPDFTKAELSFSRLQKITDNWNIFGSLAGQKASGPLYSSEEFGYGGQTYGRAYDSSEITGDDGIDGSLELRYQGLNDKWRVFSPTPYIFYDFGKIWNYDVSQVDTASGSSAGFGVKFNSLYNITGNFGLAFPLTRQAATPIYGQDKTGPRILLQISKTF